MAPAAARLAASVFDFDGRFRFMKIALPMNARTEIHWQRCAGLIR
jgi:hypothetical protein